MTIDPKYTRVTHILYPYSGLSKVPPDILKRAADRGTRVHNVCEGIVQGLGRWDMDPELDGYIASFEKWWALRHKIACVERRFYSDSYLITGAVDMILSTPQGHIIFDIKTSSRPSKTWALQGGAYEYMANISSAYNIVGIQFLQLKKDGSDPILHEYEVGKYWQLFEKALDLHNYFFKTQDQDAVTNYDDL